MMSSSKKCTSPFVETICLINGLPQHLNYHQTRMDETRREFFGEQVGELSLHDALKRFRNRSEGLKKCRVVYSKKIEKVEVLPYTAPIIKTLKAVMEDDIDYTLKSVDREALTSLKAQHPQFDDILLVKNGLVTDTSFCNVALFDGYNWITPAQPLLKGTTRQRLIDAGMLIERNIPIGMVKEFKIIMLFNSMNDFGTIMLSTENIYY